MQLSHYGMRVASLTVAALAACSAASSASSKYGPQVVIISVDGLRPDAISDATSPTLMMIARRGTQALKVETIRPSETTPSHASMLSGYGPKVHRIEWDGWQPERGNITVPTLLSVARQNAMQTVMIVGKHKLLHIAPQGGIFISATRGDDEIINEAIVRAGLPFDILFIHLPNVDLVGHAKGWMSADYIAQVTAMDRAIARLLPAIPLSATIIITADHGGMGNNHGAELAQNMSIPWIATGPRIAFGKTVTTPMKTMDTAATAAALLGLVMPADTHGRPASEAILAAPVYLPSEIFPSDEPVDIMSRR